MGQILTGRDILTVFILAASIYVATSSPVNTLEKMVENIQYNFVSPKFIQISIYYSLTSSLTYTLSMTIVLN